MSTMPQNKSLRLFQTLWLLLLISFYCSNVNAQQLPVLVFGEGRWGQTVWGEDTDKDGSIDGIDVFPTDPAASVDTDGDGKPDDWNTNATADQIAASSLVLDDDDDNDGYTDLEEIDAGSDSLSSDDIPSQGMSIPLIEAAIKRRSL